MPLGKGSPVQQLPRVEQGEVRPEDDAVLEQLERILASDDFDASPRSRDFVRFIIEEALAGRGEGLTQATIATRVFGRREDFDPTVDPIVRIQAGRLRRSLERYYLLSGGNDPVRIELSRGTYVPTMRSLRNGDGRHPEASAGRHPVATDGWPLVVVNSFEHAGDTAARDAAERLKDTFCVEVGRYGDVNVVDQQQLDGLGRTQGGDFALSGHVSCGAQGSRVSVRLVDGRDASQVWAEDYRGEPGASAAFFEETARVVAARIASEQGVVAQRLWADQRTRTDETTTPYGAILRSYQFFFNREPRDFDAAVLGLQRTVRERPECVLAWVQLARLYSANYSFEIAEAETPIDAAIGYAQHAVRLDPSSQRARVVLAGAFLIKGELEVARTETEKAYEINPDSLTYLEWIGWLMTMLGDWKRGPALVRRAMARNPHHIPVALHAIWADHLHRGEFEEAHEAAQRYGDATFFWRALMRACCLGHLGRRAEAKQERAELLRNKPDFVRRGGVLIGRYIKSPDLLETILDGLDKAGLAIS